MKHVFIAMQLPLLSVREMQEQDIDLIADYWMTASEAHLQGMGVDIKKVPGRHQFTQLLSEQLKLPPAEKRSFCTIWEVDGKPVGHCNTNPTYFGKEAWMHLHLWNKENRAKGFGLPLVIKSLPLFFDQLKLQRIYSEPYALNPAPNKTLAKAGFVLEREYITTPGSINFQQPVKRWVLTKSSFQHLQIHGSK